jgi:hypothetical protein
MVNKTISTQCSQRRLALIESLSKVGSVPDEIGDAILGNARRSNIRRARDSGGHALAKEHCCLRRPS